MEQLTTAACSFDGAVAQALGLTVNEYAVVAAVLTGALAWGPLAVWFQAFGTLRRAGFSQRIQRMVWWFFFVFPLAQITLILLKAQGREPFPCPWSSIVLLLAAVLFLAAAYGRHKQDGNKASNAKFLGFIALPVIGAASLTAKVTIDGVLRLMAFVL